MNAINHVEQAAVAATVQLETADPSKNLILVPVAQLLSRRSRRNVRKSARLSIPELAASISRVGLLQNLIVILAPDGERYEVVAGDRRLTALKLLVKKRRLSADTEVPCLLVNDASARTVSLAENVLREAMHPADQFEAFAALVAEGRPVEDIAADFGVSPLVVQRRLRLGNVSPRLLADYRADEVTLEQLMALTVTDDHAGQEAAFYGAPEWQRSAPSLRARLTEREIDAGQPLARFVGMEAYAAAGGGIRRDLFADDDGGIYLSDAVLLESLARDKLEALAVDVRAEGWAWVEVVPQLSYAERQAFQSAPLERHEPNAREARRITSLASRLGKINVELEEAFDAGDESKADKLRARREQVAGELEGLEASLLGYTPDVRANAGAIVSIDRTGEVVIHRGLLREAEAKALRALARIRQGLEVGESANDDHAAVPEAVPSGMSDRLAQRLSAHRTAALQIEVARHPHVALAATVHGMVQTVLLKDQYAERLPLGVRLTMQDRLEGMAPDWPESPAAVALRELQEVMGQGLRAGSADLLSVLLAKSQDELVQLLAVCVAATVDATVLRADQPMPGMALEQAVGLDMAGWWKPTGEGYFMMMSKAAILEAVGEFAPLEVTRLAKLKKTGIACEAERLVAGTEWMPVIFRGKQHVEPEVTPDTSVNEEDGIEAGAEVIQQDRLAA